MGTFVRIDNIKHVKELKAEIDIFVEKEFDLPDPKRAEGDPFDFRHWGDPGFLVRLLAERIDNLERQAAGAGRHFIKAQARPETNTVIRPQVRAPQVTLNEPAPGQGMEMPPNMPMPAMDKVRTRAHNTGLATRHEAPTDNME